MALKLNAIYVFCCMAIPASADVGISLSGTVKDTEGAAIAGAVAVLAFDTTINDTTDENGNFVITNTSLPGNPSKRRFFMQNIRNISINGNKLRFFIASSANSGAVSLFSGNGKKCAGLSFGKIEHGLHEYTLPELAAGFYVMNITAGRDFSTWKLLNTGQEIYISDNSSVVKNPEPILRNAAADYVDTLIVKKGSYKTVEKAVSSYQQSGIAIVMEKDVTYGIYAYSATKENTCADCVIPEPAEPNALSSISKLPDPFIRIGGTRISKKSEWRCRRQEILRQAEKYIFGEKPAPGVVTGSVTDKKISVHVEDKGKEIDFSADIVLPSTGRKPYPAIINVGAKGGFGGIVLGESRILQQGVAVIYYNNYDLGKEGTPEQSRGKPNPGKFYDIYGSNHSAGLLMAWAWGASRLIDVIQQSGTEIIDPRRLGVTGCSRSGKGAFTIGIYDERIALVIPHETSTGGVPAYRIVDKLNTERTDHNYFGLNWLSNNFEPFVFKNNVSNAVKLPIDAHSLVATIAPRGLLILENPAQKQMSAPAGYVSASVGAEVYKALGVENNISYFSNVSGVHCSYMDGYTDILVRNIAKFLKHDTSAETGKITAGSGGTLNISEWKEWAAPVLEDDTDIYDVP